jgi:hypothetical protein
MKHSHDVPEDLRPVAERLVAQRAQLTPLELDRIKQESRARSVHDRSHRRQTPVMRTRSTILGVLVSGIVLSSSGAALGISALASGDSASQAQYPNTTVPTTPTQTTEVVPTKTTEVVPPTSTTPPTGGNGPDQATEKPSVLGATETNDSSPGTATTGMAA